MFDINSFFRRLTSFRSVAWRALVFGLAWYFLPAWFFVMVALVLYFAPWFKSSNFLPAFLAVIAIYFLSPGGISYAFFGALLFGWLMAIRGLLFVDRKMAYDILNIALVFFLVRLFFLANLGLAGFGFFVAFVIAALIGFSMDSFFKDFSGAGVRDGSLLRPAAGLFALVSWEIILACSALSLDFIYQSVIAFVLIVGFAQLLEEYFSGRLSSRFIFVVASVAFCLLVLVITSASFAL